jgi:hypothetical protein
MGGLVLDIYVVFLWKSIHRVIQFIRSLRWKRVAASVSDVMVQVPLMGCPSVRVSYRVDSNPRYLEGQDDVPFCIHWSAKDYARGFPRGTRVTVRIRSEETLFFKLDQR